MNVRHIPRQPPSQLLRTHEIGWLAGADRLGQVVGDVAARLTRSRHLLDCSHVIRNRPAFMRCCS